MFGRSTKLAFLATAAVAACGVGVAADRAEVPDGTTVKVRLNQTLNSEKHGTGSGFTASVTDAVYGDEGAVLIPAGSVVNGKILAFQEDPPRLQLEFTNIDVRGESHELDASLVEFSPTKKSEMKDEGKKIGGGAAAGAIVGGLAGGEVKDAAVGAVAGAAAGTGVALLTKEHYAFVPAGSVLQFELLRPLPVSLEAEEGSSKESPSDREAATAD
ncbi:MAG: hypothetical protein PVF05_01115 [Gemmatimonadales bacterium]|jgi:hypothetical protein